MIFEFNVPRLITASPGATKDAFNRGARGFSNPCSEYQLSLAGYAPIAHGLHLCSQLLELKILALFLEYD